jgi:stearoyl-CoA desaturase (Delta-9 desaturase)
MPHFAALATAWWKPVLFIIIAGHLTNVCVTIFLHRAQTHRGVKLHYLAALPMRIWLWLSTPRNG